uniref:CFEM domain-containing protein n=1 Tax=Heterorhabditis bacteriophora TaxID=37862 RepID=A0A1I7WJC9_HETBA
MTLLSFLREKTTSNHRSIFAPQPHLESAVPLDSSVSTGINGNPKAPCPVNSPLQIGLLSTKSNMKPSVVMQQNDLPTSLSSKWSFLFNNIQQISYLTTVAPAHKIAHPSCPTRCTEGDFAVDVVGCPGSTHEYDCCTNPFFVTSNNFPQKILLVLLLLFSESSGGTHFSNLRISPFHEIVSKLFPFFVCDGFTSNYDFEASAFGVRGVPERCRSLTSKSTALKRRNQYLEVPWERTPSPSTEHIDLHFSLVETRREYSWLIFFDLFCKVKFSIKS